MSILHYPLCFDHTKIYTKTYSTLKSVSPYSDRVQCVFTSLGRGRALHARAPRKEEKKTLRGFRLRLLVLPGDRSHRGSSLGAPSPSSTRLSTSSSPGGRSRGLAPWLLPWPPGRLLASGRGCCGGAWTTGCGRCWLGWGLSPPLAAGTALSSADLT